jgi:predicted nucleic acid-binding protein
MVNGKMHIVDTYAWIEYFIGSEKGEKAAVLIDDPNEHLITVECCLAEIRGWTLRESQDFDEIYAIINGNSEILRVFTRMWIRAAEIRHEVRKTVPGFGTH